MFRKPFPKLLLPLLIPALLAGPPALGLSAPECVRAMLGPFVSDLRKPIKESKGRILCEQIRDALNRNAAKGEQIGEGRNIAVAQYWIDGDSGTKIGVSGTIERPEIVPVPKSREFTTILDFSDRSHDAEVKILEALNRDLRTDASGVIRIYSERIVCKSCSGVIREFQKKYPRIEIIVTTGGKK